MNGRTKGQQTAWQRFFSITRVGAGCPAGRSFRSSQGKLNLQRAQESESQSKLCLGTSSKGPGRAVFYASFKVVIAFNPLKFSGSQI